MSKVKIIFVPLSPCLPIPPSPPLPLRVAPLLSTEGDDPREWLTISPSPPSPHSPIYLFNKVNQNREPPLSRGVKPISPPQRSTVILQKYSPSPDLPDFFFP